MSNKLTKKRGNGESHIRQLHNSTEATRAALFSDRALMVHLNGGGWLSEVSVASVLRDRGGGTAGRGPPVRGVTGNLPDRSVGVMNLGFDHIPKPIDIFLDVEHRQRHGTSEP